jgi:acyl-CoA hydrolase
MSDAIESSSGTDGGGHLLRWLVLVALALAAVMAGRKVALDRADREFEERLRQLDANRE